MMREGGCYCAKVRYRVEGDPIAVNCCHCHDCQRLTGSAFAINATWAPERLAVLSGEPVTKDGAARCGDCGVLLWATNQYTGDTLYVRAGTLDDGKQLVPDTHYFVSRKHPWIVIPPGVRTFDELPPDAP